MKAIRLFVGVAVLGLSSVSYAVTGDVQFSGSIANTCSITSPANGTVVTTDESNLSSQGTGGAAGGFSAKCTGTGTLTIAAPVSGGSNPSATTNTSAIHAAGGGGAALTSSGGTGYDAVLNGSTVGYAVHMAAASSSGTLLPGSYSYTTTVTLIAK